MIIGIALIALDSALILDAMIRAAITHEKVLLHAGLAICATSYTCALFSTEPPEAEPITWILTGLATIALAAAIVAYATVEAENTLAAERAREQRLADVKRRIAERREDSRLVQARIIERRPRLVGLDCEKVRQQEERKRQRANARAARQIARS